METRFQYDLRDKQLRFHVRQRVTTEQKLEFKAVGLLDPASGGVSNYRVHLKQYVHAGGALELKDVASKPLKLGAGVAVVSAPGGSSAKPATTRGSASAAAAAAGAPTSLALLEGPNTVLTLRASADFNLAERRLSSRKGLVKVSHSVPGFTRRQDLKLSAGLTVDWQPEARREPRPALFLQARENNWAATLREGAVTVTYDL
ncbi:hypothetical protein GPECTOR_55g266 [Gonium pectorale]|uniref:Uncharacterized protein n=1 Tax=Gonium pectorale TaxID=33097 RepID=A0A150G7P0_GONPE|nr:hypothetical protein GPECTOR_55g266 [Gonium pectorale]|eukprot:KXZ45360.1 hypothetical protein GPECTOR_55g266 [Gonium pectorale]